jgi:hypothetical protein
MLIQPLRFETKMKARLLSQLNSEDVIKYKQSSFYQDFVLANYQFNDNSIAYYTDYFNNEHIDNSIIVFDTQDTPILALYSFSKLPVFSNFGQHVMVIETLFKSSIEKNEGYRILIKKLNEVLAINSFTEIKFYTNDFLCSEYYSKISATEIEYNSWVDLSLSEQNIKTNLRKSYKSLVNWGEKNITSYLIDKNNPDYKKFIEQEEKPEATKAGICNLSPSKKMKPIYY